MGDAMFRISNLTHLTLVKRNPYFETEAAGLFLQEFSSLDMTYVLHAILEEHDVSEGELAKKSFFRAVDTVAQNPKLVEQGMVRAMELQKAVVAQVKHVLDRRLWKGTSKKMMGRVIVLERPLHAFQSASALRRLAMFLLFTLAEKWSKAGNQPLAICARNEERKRYLCVGVADQTNAVQGNPYGALFRDAAETTGAGITHDRFDMAVAEVPEDDFPKFIDELVLRLTRKEAPQPDSGTAEPETGPTEPESGSVDPLTA